ncbi:penicillin acylase family protein [Alteriqipengyuania sp.]|uniref:penicillin acylase family protein n=1 Tax=Alteriqipengyuania sp. TaxID=2800692 RepID=UPI003511376F
MKRVLAIAGFLVVAVVLIAAIGLMVWEPFFARDGVAPEGDRTYTAEIVRDEFGVPHIYGATDPDVAYGVAIAHSEDDFTTLQDVVAMSRGRYGAIAGQNGASVDYVYHLLDARGIAEREWASLPEDTRALLDAYAVGLNDYAEQNPGEVKLGNMFPVNGVDIAAGFALRQPFFFGLDRFLGPLVAGEPLPPEYGPQIPASDLAPPEDGPRIMEEPEAQPLARASDPTPGSLRDDFRHAGSNAFAVSPEKSGGPTILVSNAHQPWRGPVAWYEMVVESGEGWHFAGANFPGSPFPFLGHNENLGWTNTVNTPDMIDIYQLVLDDSGTRYRFDGEWRDLEATDVTLPVKVGPFTLPVGRTVYRSVHGPVIKNDKGAFAVRFAALGSIDQLDAYYRLNRSENLAEWREIMARGQIPSTNFIYGDAEGNIAYIYNAAIPDRPKGYDWRGVLPGDTSKALWTGKVPYESLPQYFNPASGWVMNANNTPFLAAGPGSDLDPADFAPEMGVELKMTNRGRRAWSLMSEADVIDRDTLARIKFDTGYAREGYVARMMDEIEAIDPREHPELAEARTLMLEWDYSADNIGRADSIALLVIREFMSSAYNKKPWPDVVEELTKAKDHLQTHFGRLTPPMGELLRLRQGEVDLPLDGGSDTLRASTTWDVEDDGRLAVRHGDSFIMWIEWLNGQPVASRSIQPFGAATTRPDSPHYADQTTLFVQHRLKPVHFWRDDALTNAVTRQTVSSKRQ